MKKILMIAAMMVATMTASAQYEQGTFSLQPKIGATASQLSNLPDLDIPEFSQTLEKSPTGGAMVGVEAEYQALKWLGISAGVHFSEQGSGWKDQKVKVDGIDSKIKDTKVNTTNILVPITANFYIVKGLALRTGVQFGFLTRAELKSTVEAKDGETTSRSSVEQKCTDEFKKFDISIPIGISYEFNNHIVLDMRWNQGISKVNKESEPGEKDSRNQVLLLSVGYKFKL